MAIETVPLSIRIPKSLDDQLTELLDDVTRREPALGLTKTQLVRLVVARGIEAVRSDGIDLH